MTSSSVFLPLNRLTESNSSHNQLTSTPKRTGLMDPATFKLVLEHQKECSLQDKAILSCDRITIAGKKEWNTFWTAATKKVREKSKVCLGKKVETVQKPKVDFLYRIHDLNTPMLCCDNDKK